MKKKGKKQKSKRVSRKSIPSRKTVIRKKKCPQPEPVVYADAPPKKSVWLEIIIFIVRKWDLIKLLFKPVLKWFEDWFGKHS